MREIAGFMQGIGTAIRTCYDFVIATFRDVVDVLELLTKIPAFIGSVFAFLPAELLMLFLLLIGIVIVYKILGREG